MKLTPKNDKAIYSQSLPMPFHLKEDLIVELTLLHKYRIITVLLFSKYESSIFAQGKPNVRLRLLVDLGRINSLIADDYTNNSHPVSTLSDSAQDLTGRSLFCKQDCSQAYHCLQMADQRSVEMLGFSSKSLPRNDLHHASADLFLILKLHSLVLGHSCPSWPMCLVRGRYWNFSQHCYGSYPECSGHFKV